MPAPGQQAPWQQAMPKALFDLFDQTAADAINGKPGNLAYEVAELRKEIAALRAELAPVPSLIVTGRQALDEFKRLAHAGP